MNNTLRRLSYGTKRHIPTTNGLFICSFSVIQKASSMILCSPQPKTAHSSTVFLSGALVRPGMKLKVFTSIEDCTTDWLQAQPSDDIFLQYPYLSAIENCPPEAMSFYYLIFYQEDRPVGVSYCQFLQFKATRSVNETIIKTPFSRFPKLEKGLRDAILNWSSFNVLIGGNLLLTGNHSFVFIDEVVSLDEAYACIGEAMDLLKKKVQAHIWFMKDFLEEDRKNTHQWKKRQFREYAFMPTMLMRLQPEWKTFDDYLSALTSKYRVRTKRAFKKAKGVIRRELTVQEISQWREDLFDLFKRVVDKADFNMTYISPDYFYSLKKALGDQFCVIGYFLEGRLIGFHTTIENGSELEAHYLGMDLDLNRSHQLYLNMLYDIIQCGIQKRKEQISFARTAMEIKSSVGATAENMYIYLRHTNPVKNQVYHQLFRLFKPDTEAWEPRHPFSSVPVNARKVTD
jgi:hypothetical protein